MTSSRIPLDSKFAYQGAEIIPAEELGPMTEDGCRFWTRVWDVQVGTTDGCKWVHPFRFSTYEEAQAFCWKVVQVGSINPEKWWNSYDPKQSQLPDYVLDPHRPEFN